MITPKSYQSRVMERHTVTAHPRLEQILEADGWARKEAAA
jgi:hypothetical protein